MRSKKYVWFLSYVLWIIRACFSWFTTPDAFLIVFFGLFSRKNDSKHFYTYIFFFTKNISFWNISIESSKLALITTTKTIILRVPDAQEQIKIKEMWICLSSPQIGAERRILHTIQFFTTKQCSNYGLSKLISQKLSFLVKN